MVVPQMIMEAQNIQTQKHWVDEEVCIVMAYIAMATGWMRRSMLYGLL